VVAMYLVVWSAFGVAAGEAEWLLQDDGFVRDGRLVSPLYAGALLFIAGLYQWSAMKSVCLSRCRSPLRFLLERYRDGYRGALALGLVHGTLCVGCCWLLMLLAWVGGTMNLAWIGGAHPAGRGGEDASHARCHSARLSACTAGRRLGPDARCGTLGFS
jgi:predicted metal-binding membrane protein